jgi:CRP-like cAMP-binding protein
LLDEGPAEESTLERGIPKSVFDMLSAVPLFSTCTKGELRTIANLGTRLTVADGAVLTTQGNPGREFFLLTRGSARCLADGEEIATFGAGDFFGEMALLGRRPRNATVVVDGEGEVLVLNASEFRGLLDSSPSIAQKVHTAATDRQRDPTPTPTSAPTPTPTQTD